MNNTSDAAPNGAIYQQTWKADGTMEETLVVPEGSLLEAVVDERVAEKVSAVKRSRAQQRYERLTTGKPLKSKITTVHLPQDSEPWYIKRIDLAELTTINLLCNRDAKGRLNIKDSGIMASVYAASLLVCCVSGIEDATPYFESLEEAAEQVGRIEDEMVALNLVLTNKIHEINPEILTAAVAEDAIDSRQGDADVPLTVSLSSTLPSGTPPNGSGGMADTDAPS